MKRENYQEATPDGIKSANRIIGYSVAIRQLDDGKYDNCLFDGLRLLACIQDAKSAGWLKLSVEKEIIIWRWLAVTVFVNEERARNGTAEIPNGEGGFDIAIIYRGKHGSISIYPGPERFALANNVEGPAVEKYGVEKGLPLALRVYQDMVEVYPKHGFRLSKWGREGFEMLHDGFIEQLQTEGMPAMPVIH